MLNIDRMFGFLVLFLLLLHKNVFFKEEGKVKVAHGIIYSLQDGTVPLVG